VNAADRLARFALAVERLEALEESAQRALAAGTMVPGEMPEIVVRGLREAADEVLRLAPPWDVLLEGAKGIGVSEPCGGREGYRAYVESLTLYGSPTAETVQ